MQVRRVGTALAAGSALVISGMSAPAFAQSAPSRVGVAKTKPAWLGHAKTLGRASSTGQTNFRLYLTPNGGMAALQARVGAVSKPGSASYRNFITSAQYHQTYNPTSAAVAAVTKFLNDSKLSVASVAANNQYLTVSGTVAHAQAAFGTTINRYSHDGKTVQANASTLTVPATIAGAVLAISGIDTTPNISKPSKATPVPPPAAFANARPCSTSYGQLAATYQADYKTKLPKFQGKTLSYSVCGYVGQQLRSAYEGSTKLTGAGVTVAVVDAYAAPTIVADVTKYASLHGDAPYAKGQFTQNNQSSYSHFECDPSGWFGEETLDIEAVHAMAPAANIRYYGGKSCYDDDLVDTIQKVVNENKADLITNSYGDANEQVPTQSIAASEAVFLQAALQGQSFLFSSGDSGDDLASSGFLEPSYQASDPYVTAVGGTSTAIDGNGTLAAENGWGTEKYSLDPNGKKWDALGFVYGAGGGYSTLFNRPDYQEGVVPSTAPAGRGVPDVAMDADPTTGMLVGETQTYPNGSQRYGEYRIGGTSLASPLFAGMTALTLQHAGGRLGFLNPTIYDQYKAGTYTDVSAKSAIGMGAGNVRADYANSVDATDGIVYSVRSFGQDSSLPTVKGWDPVTGIGSPNAKWLTSIPPVS